LLDKKSEICQKSFGSEKGTSFAKIYKIRQISCFWHIYSTFTSICGIFESFLEIWENISLAECVKTQNRMIWAMYEAFYTDLWHFLGVFEKLGKRNYFQMYQNHNITPFESYSEHIR